MALLSALHPLAGMLVPIGIGTAFSGGTSGHVSRAWRMWLLAIAGALGLLALLSSSDHGIGATLFGEACRVGCSDYDWSDFRWVVFAPAVPFALVAVGAASTASKRMTVALFASAVTYAAQIALVIVFLALYAASWS